MLDDFENRIGVICFSRFCLKIISYRDNKSFIQLFHNT